MAIEIKILRDGDEAVLKNVANGVFDGPIFPEIAKEFLADPRHHIAVAIDNALVVGMASGIHYIHPDKAPELWINEVGVASTHQGQGIAKSLLRKLLETGKSLGCSEAWVLTDRANQAAMQLYASTGGTEESDDTVLFKFSTNV